MKIKLIIIYLLCLNHGIIAQSSITGRVFNDISANNSYDLGEELSNIRVWLFDLNAMAPRYRVSPIDSVVTNSSGIYTFSGVIAGDYQVRVMASTLPTSVTRAILDNDSYANGLTNIMAVNGTSSYANINFGFAPTLIAPVFSSARNFNWNGGNTFINQTSQIYNLTPEVCSGIPANPTITWTTDRTNTPGGGYGTNNYPQASFTGAALGEDYPGMNKGGIHTGDKTFQLLYGGVSYTTVNNDRQTTTIEFSKSVINTKFSIYDIDHADPQSFTGRIDRVKVTGYDGPNPIMPVLINPSANPWNMVSGNTICGWADYPLSFYTLAYNSTNEDHGTINVYFQNRIDKIIVEYEEWAPVMLPGKGINDATPPVSAINESSWSLRSNPTTRGISIGSIDYTIDCFTILPLSLVKFEVMQTGCNATLNWETAQEQNLDFFAVEQSSDGSNFQSFNIIKAKNIQLGSKYNYKIQPLSTKTYYRLKMTDFDGKYTYSNIVSVGACLKNYTWSVSPNPVNEGTEIRLTIISNEIKNKSTSFFIWDAAGNKVIQKNKKISKGVNLERIRINNLAAGIYMVGLFDEFNNAIGSTQKIIIK